MDFAQPPELDEIRAAVRELCEGFPGEYWRGLEPDRYPEQFVRALTEHGWLAALIPEEYGGPGLGITAASVILEEINASGGNSGACHAQMYTMGTILRNGSDEQKQRFLPRIASGELRLQAFGVTEPTVGSDTTSIQTFAERVDGGYRVRGHLHAVEEDLGGRVVHQRPDRPDRHRPGFERLLHVDDERRQALRPPLDLLRRRRPREQQHQIRVERA